MAKKKRTDKRSQREKLDSIRKASRREALMKEGVKLIRPTKVVPDKTKYNRKNLPKADTEE